jgi:thiol-disulfide isomerase/thioredoxin
VRRHAKGPPIIDASEPRIGSALPAFDGATAWLNSKPLVAARLGGRVTALQFWSGADLASDRVVPVALEWARRYAPAGLRVLFVHVPRFAFAQESSFVANDARRLGIDGPVLVDGELARACLVLAVRLDGQAVLTIEGMSGPDGLHPIQHAFVERGGSQCGFCTPGMIMTAKALLDESSEPTDEDIKGFMSGNLCRCGSYSMIFEAIRLAAERQREADAAR